MHLGVNRDLDARMAHLVADTYYGRARLNQQAAECLQEIKESDPLQ